jgi:hypothetical protein
LEEEVLVDLDLELVELEQVVIHQFFQQLHPQQVEAEEEQMQHLETLDFLEVVEVEVVEVLIQALQQLEQVIPLL